MYKFVIKTIFETYRYHKNVVDEYDKTAFGSSTKQIQISKRICEHIEFVVFGMEEKYRIILENDIIKGNLGKKIKYGCSESTYYRNRKTAYEIFIKELNA